MASDHLSGNTVRLENTIRFPLISRDTAMSIARALLHDRWGEDALQEQLPLSICEEGEKWVISGTPVDNPPRMIDNGKKFFIYINKHDGQILDVGFEWPPPSPSL